MQYYYDGAMYIEEKDAPKANDILKKAKGFEDCHFFNLDMLETGFVDGRFDFGEFTGYEEVWDIDDDIEALFNALVNAGIDVCVIINYSGDENGALRNRGKQFLRLDVSESGVIDAADKDLIAELKSRGYRITKDDYDSDDEDVCDDEPSDANIEIGFDPYMGCYSDEC